MAKGMTLRIQLAGAATVRWSSDQWATSHDTDTRNTGLGVHIVDIETKALPVGARLVFTVHWRQDDRWEGANFEVAIDEPRSQSSTLGLTPMS